MGRGVTSFGGALARAMVRGCMAVVAASAAFGTATPAAHAGDVEYVGQGTRALGRGGAFAARADDPMALTYNPAAMVDLHGTQLMLNVQNAFYDACVTREGTYGDNVASNGMTDRFGNFIEYRNVAYPRVCQNNRINPGLWLAVTHRLTDTIGVGFGLMTPAAAGHLIWGDGKGGTKDGSLPSPVRYQLIEQDIKLVDPTLGVSVKGADWFRLGISLQWGIALIKNVNMTARVGSESPNTDIRSELNAHDLFVPAAIFSAAFVPHENIDLALYGRISDDIRAKGDVKVRAGDFQNTALATAENDDVTLQSAQPAQFGMGLRYASRSQARVAGERGDPLVSEYWDVELDTTYVLASQFKAITLDVPTLPLVLDKGIRTDLKHEWKDQLSIKLGGDFNVMPGVLALRAGAHYETSAVDGSYMGIDFQPAQRFGLHLGTTVRFGRLDLSLAYAHIFQETITVPKSAAAYEQIADESPVVVNAGTYASKYDVVSLGATYKFGTLN